MELGKTEINESGPATTELDFDPDKLIGGNEADESKGRESTETLESNKNPETVLHDPEQLAEPIEGLEQTKEGFEQLDNGNTIYDHPRETGKLLNSNQGEAVPGFVGTCGLVSAENVAIMAGKDVSEADVVNVACKNGDCERHFWLPAEAKGGTTPAAICNVLGHLGISAALDHEPSIDKLADAVESGRGVIACVDVAEFWPNAQQEGGHAVTVTSVERDPEGNVTAFYVCDSGTHGHDAYRRVDVDVFDTSLDYAVTTDSIIR